MAFPSIVGTPATTALTSANPGSVNLPSGITAGELLLVMCTGDTSGTMSQSGGSDWAVIDTGTGGAASAVFAKIAEGSDTLSVQFEANDFTAIAVRIDGHGVVTPSTDILYAFTNATSQNPDPPELDTGEVQEYLWIEFFSADDDDDTTDYETSGWNKIAQIKSAETTSSCLTAAAYLESETDILNPGAMNMSASEEWVAWTIAIPATAIAPPEYVSNFEVVNQEALGFKVSYTTDSTDVAAVYLNLASGTSPGASETGILRETPSVATPYGGGKAHIGVLDDGACNPSGRFVVSEPGQYTVSIEAYDNEEPPNLLFSDHITVFLSGGLRWIGATESAAEPPEPYEMLPGLKPLVWVEELGIFLTGIAVSGGDEDENILYSTDGKGWNIANSPQGWRRGFAYSPTLDILVGVGDNSSVEAYIVTSTDSGLNWTARARPEGAPTGWYWVLWVPITGVGSGDGRFVAVSENGSDTQAMTSEDGITWTLRSTGVTGSWQSMAFAPGLGSGPGRIVAVGRSYDVDTSVMTSDDGGVTWTTRTVTTASEWRDVNYSLSRGKFFAVARTGSGTPGSNALGGMYSSDGITWTDVAMPIHSIWEGIFWSDEIEQWIAVVREGKGTISGSDSSSVCAIAHSYNEVDWYEDLQPDENSLQEVVYAESLGYFVAISEGNFSLWNSAYAYPRILSNLETTPTETGADHTIQYTGEIP